MLEFPRWKVLSVLLVCLMGLAYALPNAFENEVPSWVPTSKKVNLGLDLKGGSHLLLEIDMDAYFKEQSDNLKADVRTALRKEKIGYKNLGVRNGVVSFKLRDINQRDKALSKIKRIDRNLDIDSDGERIKASYNDRYKEDAEKKVLAQSIEIVRRRIDETGVVEPTIQRQGTNRVLIQVPGFDDPKRLKQLIGKTAKLTFHLVDRSEEMTAAKMRLKDEDGRPYVLEKRSVLTGEMLVDANVSSDENGQPAVSFRLNPQGARKFGEFSTKHKGDLFAIVLDKKVVSAPVINDPILGGSGQISGNFTFASANDLALLLRAGALPAPLKVVEERTVGASLGEDSINAGKKAAMIGVAFVMVFMFIYYGVFGIFSNIALLLNMILILASLSILQATLTLPGIAGIVLTIGMAVDANVLIFERIREEVKKGKSVYAAVSVGFSKAFKTIIDSNITTLIAAFLLFIFGTGSVKGFAVTLSIGIIASMFSAILVTRMFIIFWIRNKKPNSILGVKQLGS